jgi:hypothetical protein
LPGKVLGGTGILPVRAHRLEACATKGGGHGGPPHQSFHVLGVSQRLMSVCPSVVLEVFGSKKSPNYSLLKASPLFEGHVMPMGTQRTIFCHSECSEESLF